jgi:hypothetical protein
MRTLAIFSLITVAIFVLIGCSGNTGVSDSNDSDIDTSGTDTSYDSTDYSENNDYTDYSSNNSNIVDNTLDMFDGNVTMVKAGHMQSYPNIAIGDAFAQFFATPKWTSFKSTEGDDVVEFTGYCTYDGVEVKAKIQFIVFSDQTFEIGHLSFNDITQTELMKIGLINKIYESY